MLLKSLEVKWGEIDPSLPWWVTETTNKRNSDRDSEVDILIDVMPDILTFLVIEGLLIHFFFFQTVKKLNWHFSKNFNLLIGDDQYKCNLSEKLTVYNLLK